MGRGLDGSVTVDQPSRSADGRFRTSLRPPFQQESTVPGGDMALTPRQLNQALQALLEPLGFEKDPEAIAAVGYRGAVAGRVLRISAAPRSRSQFTGIDNTSFRVYTGIAISVIAETEIATRLTVGTAPFSWLARRFLLPRLGMKQVPSAEGLHVWALEEDWARVLMASEPFQALASRGSDLSISALVFTPENLSLTCSPQREQLNTTTMGQWLQLVSDLAAAGEKHPPRQRAELTWLERQPRGLRLAIVVGLLFGVPMLLLAMFAVLVGAILVMLSILL